MLERLTINNLVLIEKQQIEFKEGLIAITGETGAGKSVLIDSIALSLGQRTNADKVRINCDSATIQADFLFKNSHSSFSILEDYGIDIDDNEFSIRRKITNDGRSNIFINGAKVTQSQIKAISTNLVDMHSQYDNQLLLNSKNHINLLDNFAQINKDNLHTKFSTYKTKFNLLEDFKTKIDDQEKELTLQQAYLDELLLLDIQENEVDSLTSERKMLMNAEKVINSMQAVVNYLPSDIVHSIQSAETNLIDASVNLTEDMAKESQNLINRLAEVSVELEDITSEVNHMANSIEVNPQRLNEVDDRLFGIKDCAIKHKVEPEQLGEVLETLKQTVSNLENFEENISKLENEVAQCKKAFETEALKIAKTRLEKAPKLEKAIESVLKDLHMKDAKFKVKFDDLEFDKWNKDGSQAVEFYVATNLGQNLSALAKVASGGEVARLMLALKVVFFKNIDPQTLIFDEIDTGVGGQVADSVGECLKQLANKHQVIVISHQAQVASKADQHLKISKTTKANSTYSQVNELTKDEIIEELARMISGKDITDEGRNLAIKLINN